MKNLKLLAIGAAFLIPLALSLPGSFTSSAQQGDGRAVGAAPQAVGGDDLFSWHRQRLVRLVERLNAPPRHAGAPGRGQRVLSWEVFREEVWPEMVVGFAEADREVPVWLEHNSFLFRVFIAPGKWALSPAGVPADRLVGLSLMAVAAGFLWSVVLRACWRAGKEFAARPAGARFIARVNAFQHRVRSSWGGFKAGSAARVKRWLVNHQRAVYAVILWHVLGLGLLALFDHLNPEFPGGWAVWVLAPAVPVALLLLFLSICAVALYFFVIVFVILSIHYPLSFVMMPVGRVRNAYATARKLASSDPGTESVKLSPYMKLPWLDFVSVFILVVGLWKLMSNFPEDGAKVAFLARWCGFLLLLSFPVLVGALGNLLHWLLVALMLPLATVGTPFFEGKRKVLTDAFFPRPEEAKPAIPDGVTFGDRVLLLPPVDAAFERALTAHDYKLFWHRYRVSSGGWVNRGDALCEFLIRKPATLIERYVGEDLVVITLRSPVSGIVLKTTFQFGEPWGHILLPEGEPPPEPVEYVFGDYLNFCRDLRTSVPRKTKQAAPAPADDQLEAACERLRAEGYEVRDARETYGHDIRWLRERDAELHTRLFDPAEPATT